MRQAAFKTITTMQRGGGVKRKMKMYKGKEKKVNKGGISFMKTNEMHNVRRSKFRVGRKHRWGGSFENEGHNYITWHSETM